ncbi:S-adenosyl-L-methionine-dependent methyltransferase [Phanerochaete sordida]|uniref:S-adenosyl-L-methionine-dependent methyltransferase n=1 Tax=Phanerochaete sordida TaxID=48140 RepID=A0A9P3GT08_9APHY|nr:S-adenosyl-L-methionine-dependent methyltransferase [Phanerochaete sordida]
MSSLSAENVAALCLHDPKHFATQLAQTEHRLALLSKWDAQLQGARVIELGAGTGECTAVLAEAVGPNGHVTAVDPGALDYGGPVTLGQAQSHLSEGRLGSRITWVQAKPIEFLRTNMDVPQYDVAVLAHCIWYFGSPSVIAETFQLLGTRAKKICIAEWSLNVADAHPAHAHILSVLAEAALECRKDPETSISNVRTVVSPIRIKELAVASGLKVEKEDVVTPGEGIFDGRWEAFRVLGDKFLQEIRDFVKNEREKSVVLALRDATVASVARLEDGVKGVRSMDTWVGVMSAVAE